MPKHCVGCGAPIIWVKTPMGKRQPFDAKPEKRGVPAGKTSKGGTPIFRMQDTYMPHHATCPAVEMFRKQQDAKDSHHDPAR